MPRNLPLTFSGDVGGQKTLRSYWKNYFEKTDTLVWVVDATDRLRIDDCRDELAGLLLEEVCPHFCGFIDATLRCITASYGSKSSGIPEQDRC